MKRRNIIVVLAVLAVALVCAVGIYFYNKDEDTTKLNEGLYSLQSYGGLYYQENEDIKFNLLLYYYNEDMDINKIDKYHDFYLLTEDNSKIEINVTKDSFQILEEQDIMQGDISVTFLDGVLVDGKISITAMSYKDENDKEFILDIGKISIYSTDFQNKYLDFSANKYDWTKFESPLMSTYDISVDSLDNSNLTINSIDFGMTQIKGEEININLEESKEIKVDVELEDIEGNFIFYLKPLLNFECNGENYSEIQSNISTQRFISSENTLYDYFLNIQE